MINEARKEGSKGAMEDILCVSRSTKKMAGSSLRFDLRELKITKHELPAT